MHGQREMRMKYPERTKGRHHLEVDGGIQTRQSYSV
jgi:hypothetical protein